jgi:hypothetical protein
MRFLKPMNVNLVTQNKKNIFQNQIKKILFQMKVSIWFPPTQNNLTIDQPSMMIKLFVPLKVLSFIVQTKFTK